MSKLSADPCAGRQVRTDGNRDLLAALTDMFEQLSDHVDTTDTEMVAARQEYLEAVKRRLLDEESAR
jgi:hypothetical protein